MLADDMNDIAYELTRRGMETITPVLADGDDRHLSVYGGLHLLSAIALTRTGDDTTAREILRTTAADLARRVDESTNYFGLAFGPTNVAMHMASIDYEMRRSQEALRVAEESMSPGRRRCRGAPLIWSRWPARARTSERMPRASRGRRILSSHPLVRAEPSR
ncbi:hypothetical protein [Nonomuraea sp. NPDC003754]